MKLYIKTAILLCSLTLFSCSEKTAQNTPEIEYPTIAEDETNQVSIVTAEIIPTETSYISKKTDFFNNTSWNSCDEKSPVSFEFTENTLKISNTQNGVTVSETSFEYTADTEKIFIFDDEGRDAGSFDWKLNGDILEITNTSGNKRKFAMFNS